MHHMNTSAVQSNTYHAKPAFINSLQAETLDKTPLNSSKDETPPNTMSSLVVSGLTDKPHETVMRDIVEMMEELGQDTQPFAGLYRDSCGKFKPYFLLPHREADILLSGYSVHVRAMFVDDCMSQDATRRQEDIEAPKTVSDALKLARALEDERLKLEKEVWALEKQISQDSHKVDFYYELADSSHLYDLDEAAKIFETSRSRLFAFLRNHKVLMRGKYKMNRPYQKYLDNGRFELKILHYTNAHTGKLETKSMPFLTGKGLIWLHQYIEKHGRDEL